MNTSQQISSTYDPTGSAPGRAWQAVTSAFARRLFLDRHAAFWLRELHPVWSLDEIRARVVDVVAETADVKTFVIRPNARWQGHRAGQYATVEVEIDGVRTRRCYSISSGPGAALPAITVKRTPGGRVSAWLHDHVKPGDLLTLSVAMGDFVLPEPAPARLLLVSGGSGITPVMSMLRDLDARSAVGDVVFLYYARTRDDVIFRRELETLAAGHPGLRLIVRTEDDPSAPGLFSEAELRRLVPDFAERDTFLCGPPGLMDRVEELWKREGLSACLRRERFVAATVVPAPATGALAARVTLGRAVRTFTASGSGTLLTELERAGANPASGCRMGICQTCKCRKTSGAVQNVLTGEISNEPDEDIQLCISVPRSDVTLDL